MQPSTMIFSNMFGGEVVISFCLGSEAVQATFSSSAIVLWLRRVTKICLS